MTSVWVISPVFYRLYSWNHRCRSWTPTVAERDRDIQELKSRLPFQMLGTPRDSFISYTMDNNFTSNNPPEDEHLIPDFLFEERKNICIKFPYCIKNENASKKFISKLNAFTNFKYIFIILWQTSKSKACSISRTKLIFTSLTSFTKENGLAEKTVWVKQCEISKQEYLNTLIFATTQNQHATFCKTQTIHSNGGSFVPSNLHSAILKRKIIEGLTTVQQKGPTLMNKQINCYVAKLFREQRIGIKRCTITDGF